MCLFNRSLLLEKLRTNRNRRPRYYADVDLLLLRLSVSDLNDDYFFLITTLAFEPTGKKE